VKKEKGNGNTARSERQAKRVSFVEIVDPSVPCYDGTDQRGAAGEEE